MEENGNKDWRKGRMLMWSFNLETLMSEMRQKSKVKVQIMCKNIEIIGLF